MPEKLRFSYFLRFQSITYVICANDHNAIHVLITIEIPFTM